MVGLLILVCHHPSFVCSVVFKLLLQRIVTLDCAREYSNY